MKKRNDWTIPKETKTKNTINRISSLFYNGILSSQLTVQRVCMRKKKNLENWSNEICRECQWEAFFLCIYPRVYIRKWKRNNEKKPLKIIMKNRWNWAQSSLIFTNPIYTMKILYVQRSVVYVMWICGIQTKWI